MKTHILSLLFALLLVLPVLAQNGDITGKVIDESTGEPLPGVTVQVQGTTKGRGFAGVMKRHGTTKGAITDLDGNYSISAGPENILIFSFIGYKNVSETVGNRSVIDITLGQDVSNLEEVVVVGYSSQKKSDMTGAIVAVDLRERRSLARVPVLREVRGPS